MKKILIPIGALLVSGLAHSQTTGASSTENYVESRIYLEPVTTSSTGAKQIQTVQYFDGLGRPKQVINVKASPTGKDVVTHVEYDGFGRQAKDFLPVPQQGTQNGAIYTTPLSNATQPALYGSEKIYAEKQFENSPLDRILQQKQVGTAWNDKPVQIGYDANTTGDAVKKYTTVTTWVDGATSSVLSQSSNYGAAQLYKNTVTDEDGNVTIEFKNGEGQVVLVRKVISDTEKADTYYVYNEYNQLAYVVPPKAAVAADPNTVLVDLCYQYKYDGRSRLVEKKLPGKGWEYMIYDTADRLVMSQDANLRAQNKWLFSKHDKFSRVLYTGIVIDGGARNAIQGHLEAVFGSNTETEGSFQHSGITVYHGKTAAPTAFDKILTVNYYDKYPQYDFNPTFPASIIGQPTLTDNASTAGRSTKGLPVMSLIKNIEDDNWTKNYIYYDEKGRSIGSYSINHLGGRTKVDSKLDFAGVVQQSVTTHKRLDTDTDRVITENFTYDNQNRLLTHTHQVDSNPMEYLAQNSYNELSQISAKKVGGISPSVPLQDISYSYNIRGWMTKINDPANLNGKLFGYEIKYNTPENAAPKFNGNIAEVDWITGAVPNDPKRRYSYEYDKLNRLTNAFYREPSTGVSGSFNEYLTYDLNGNINTLKRSAPQVYSPTATLVDDLDYQYAGNRLTKVIENIPNSTGYEGGNNTIDYNLNGSMINMKDKGITGIGYNYLNLPDAFGITQNDPLGGTAINFSLNYLYRADGTKVRKTYYSGGGRGNPTITNNITDYLDGFQYRYSEITQCLWCRTSVAYEQEAFKDPIILDPTLPPGTLTPTWILDFVPTAEGFYSFTENRYIYQYRDHLGNARVSYAKDSQGNLQITDTNNYYAFGMNHIGGMKSMLGGYQSYKYNGKEIQESGMYDYGARFYMPDIGRWGVVDPLAEKMTRHSPYNYAFNNPIRFIDPDGREGILYGEQARNAFRALQNSMPPIDYVNNSGNKIGTDGTDTKGTIMVTNRQDINAIRTAERNGSHVTTDQLSEFNADMIVPSDVALQESLNVLARGVANGGFREESSSIGENDVILRGETGPLPTVSNNVATAPALIPTNKTTHTTIHLHPAGIFVSNNTSYPFNALTPTPGVDNITFAGKGTNIIVGRLQIGTDSNITRNTDGSFSDSRPIGAAIYSGSNISAPRMILNQQIIRNILNRNGN